jgi:sulfate adenylyltransferase subunit 2
MRAREGEPGPLPPHLCAPESESIHVIREVAAEFRNPVMLYSSGKGSSGMLHLALKAFWPAPPPFPLLHVDATWKFREMIVFRDAIVRAAGMRLIVHANGEGLARKAGPSDHGSDLHTQVMKTDALRQALDEHGFDAAFGGAHREEEKSRAKECIFSFRDERHGGDPRNQRPELWRLFNARIGPGEPIRVFPPSNRTELDVRQYILLQDLPVVPLYFAAERAAMSRDGKLRVVDDARFRLHQGESAQSRTVRFRTLGGYPLTGAIESTDRTLPEIAVEMFAARTSECQGCLIDIDEAGSSEKKTREGCF